MNLAMRRVTIGNSGYHDQEWMATLPTFEFQVPDAEMSGLINLQMLKKAVLEELRKFGYQLDENSFNLLISGGAMLTEGCGLTYAHFGPGNRYTMYGMKHDEPLRIVPCYYHGGGWIYDPKTVDAVEAANPNFNRTDEEKRVDLALLKALQNVEQHNIEHRAGTYRHT